ncbi:MAG: DUF1127 domain-containing protein [Pseudomonadota bacterium]
MAHSATLPHTGLDIAGRIASLITRVKTERARAADYRRTYSELQRLSNRELDDIGIRRCDIADIAHEQAYCA